MCGGINEKMKHKAAALQQSHSIWQHCFKHAHHAALDLALMVKQVSGKVEKRCGGSHSDGEQCVSQSHCDQC